MRFNSKTHYSAHPSTFPALCGSHSDKRTGNRDDVTCIFCRKQIAKIDNPRTEAQKLEKALQRLRNYFVRVGQFSEVAALNSAIERLRLLEQEVVVLKNRLEKNS